MSQNFFQIIRPVHVHLKTDKVDLKKRPPWKIFFLHFFSIDSWSRHEKYCQMLQRLFWLFQCSNNPQCPVNQSYNGEIVLIGGVFKILEKYNLRERWKQVSEILERWKQVFRNLREIFPKSSFKNLREIVISERWKQIPEILERWKQVPEIACNITHDYYSS